MGLNFWKGGATQTALRCVRIRKAQRCFCLSVRQPRKAKTASPACRKTPSGVLPEGESLPFRLLLKTHPYFVALSVGHLRATARAARQ